MTHRQNELLRAMANHPRLSLAGLARQLGWPNKAMVHREVQALVERGLAVQLRNYAIPSGENRHYTTRPQPRTASLQPKTEAKASAMADGWRTMRG